MKSVPHCYQFRVLEKHLDTFGHINNATYLELYEEARWDWITQNGHGLKEILKNQKGPVILHVDLTFKKEFQNRELVTIESLVTGRKNRLVMTLAQRMIKEDGQVGSEVKMEVGFFDLQTRKLILADDSWYHALGVSPNDF